MNWQEITYQEYYNALCELPPIYSRTHPGRFAMGEPLRHNANGQAVYHIYSDHGDKYWKSTGTIAEMNA